MAAVGALHIPRCVSKPHMHSKMQTDHHPMPVAMGGIGALGFGQAHYGLNLCADFANNWVCLL